MAGEEQEEVEGEEQDETGEEHDEEEQAETENARGGIYLSIEPAPVTCSAGSPQRHSSKYAFTNTFPSPSQLPW